MLLPKKLLAPENETQLRKQKKVLPEGESVKLHQEKVLEEQPEEKVLEEKPQGDLLEGEDARTSSFFILFWYKPFILLISYIQYVEVSITFDCGLHFVCFDKLPEIKRSVLTSIIQINIWYELLTDLMKC